MIRSIRRLTGGGLLGAEGGASTAEFAIAVPAFLLFLLGIIEVARGCWTVNVLQNAVAQAARYATLSNGNKPTAAGCDSTSVATYQTAVQDYLDSVLNATIPSATPAVSSPACPIGGFPTVTLTISATYTYNFILGTLIPATAITVQQQQIVTTPLS
jgi:Flp pilus assembly protein TadG